MKIEKTIILGFLVLLMVCIAPVSGGTYEDCLKSGYWPIENSYYLSHNMWFPNVNGQTGHGTYCLYKWEGNWDKVTTTFDVPTYLEITALTPQCSVSSNIVTCTEFNVPKVEYFIDTNVKPNTPIGTCWWPSHLNIQTLFLPRNSLGISWGGSCVVDEPSIPALEFPSAILPVIMIIGFLGAVLYIQRTREH